MPYSRFLSILFLGSLLAVPAVAQFTITVTENNQAFAVANGSTLTLNSAVVGQSVTATVTLTYLDPGTVNFAAPPQILGSTAFTLTPFAAPVVLTSLESTSFTFQYTPTDTAQALGQVSLTFTANSGIAGAATQNGAILLNLVGTAPNLTVSTVDSTNNNVIVPNGGSFQLPSAVVGSVSSMTVSISNPGSGPATVNSITISGAGFQLSGRPLLPLTLSAGSQLLVSIQFTPSSAGTGTASFQIASTSGSYTASVSANAIASFLTYQITQGNQTSPLTLNQTITFANTNVGDTAKIIIQFQNIAAFPAVLSAISITGAAFSIVDEPFLPVALQPQQSNTITIAYSPTQPGPASGRLLIGNDTFPLTGQGVGALLQISYQSNGTPVTLNPGAGVTFSAVAVGGTSSLQFSITNNGTASGSVVSIGLQDTSGVFSLHNLPTLSFQLAPNASTSFSVNFTPQSLGEATTMLLVNSQAITLVGLATAPPSLPAYQFTGASGIQQPLQQPAIGIALESPYPLTLNGKLFISVTPSTFVTDQAVQFSSGGTQASFTIPAGTLQAVFPGGSNQIQFQTGTVAGSILFSPTFAVGSGNGTDLTPTSPATLQVTVPSAAPTLLSASIGSVSATGFTVDIIGFTTTRSLSDLMFQFTAGSGFTLNTAGLTVNVSGAASVWFLNSASQTLGGQFNVEVPFTLAMGTTSANLSSSISSISVVAANAIGNSNTIQVGFP